MFSLVSTRIPRVFPIRLFCSWVVPSIYLVLSLVTLRSVENLSESVPLLIFDKKERKGSHNGFIFSFSKVDCYFLLNFDLTLGYITGSRRKHQLKISLVFRNESFHQISLLCLPVRVTRKLSCSELFLPLGLMMTLSPMEYPVPLHCRWCLGWIECVLQGPDKVMHG